MMNQILKILIKLLLALILLLGLGVVTFVYFAKRELRKRLEAKATLENVVPIDLPVYDMTLVNALDNSMHRLTDLQKPVTILNFWELYCKACVEELPEIEKFNEKYKGQYEVVLISRKDNEKTRSFLQKEQYKLNFYFPKGKIPEVFDKKSTPRVYVLSGDKLYLEHHGMFDWENEKFNTFLKKIYEANSLVSNDFQ